MIVDNDLVMEATIEVSDPTNVAGSVAVKSCY